MKLLVTGLPRSGTAWLAVALSYTASCDHEPLAGVSSLEQVWQLFHRTVGISDSTFSLFLGQTLQRIQPQTLVIRRPLGEVVESLARVGLPRSTKLLELMEERLQPWLTHSLVKAVSFSDLWDLDLLEEIWQHLGFDPEAWYFPRDQLAQLLRMRVTVREVPAVSPHEAACFAALLREVGADAALAG